MAHRKPSFPPPPPHLPSLSELTTTSEGGGLGGGEGTKPLPLPLPEGSRGGAPVPGAGPPARDMAGAARGSGAGTHPAP